MFLRIDRKTIQQMIGDKTRGTTKENKYVSFYYILKYKIGCWGRRGRDRMVVGYTAT